MYGTSDWCFCSGLVAIPKVRYPDAETERGFGLVENDSADWSEFEASPEVYAKLDAMEVDFPF